MLAALLVTLPFVRRLIASQFDFPLSNVRWSIKREIAHQTPNYQASLFFDFTLTPSRPQYYFRTENEHL